MFEIMEYTLEFQLPNFGLCPPKRPRSHARTAPFLAFSMSDVSDANLRAR